MNKLNNDISAKCFNFLCVTNRDSLTECRIVTYTRIHRLRTRNWFAYWHWKWTCCLIEKHEHIDFLLHFKRQLVCNTLRLLLQESKFSWTDWLFGNVWSTRLCTQIVLKTIFPVNIAQLGHVWPPVVLKENLADKCCWLDVSLIIKALIPTREVTDWRHPSLIPHWTPECCPTSLPTVLFCSRQCQCSVVALVSHQIHLLLPAGTHTAPASIAGC